ncbi:hypothetical protein Q8W25_03630 [Shimia thalassica]|uniref:hypothetical protein n=1 Tax=Shimia thalassica TaxID=1715693 RepID=UPI001C091BF9|nr:hypothetical protein [Shimia thalassica]MBU2941053.1 hypothetical protein [Shimia thalassica]MDO6505264.1 hypothetical protein [Shimia thalassica]MDP2493089.1 hypothetical protein [Shimia thalassica]
MRILRITKTMLLAAVLALSLGLNVATVAIGSVATLLSSTYEAITGAASVVGRTDRDLATKSKQLDAKSRQLEATSRQLEKTNKQLDTSKRKVASLSDEVAELRKPKVVRYRGQSRMLSEAVEDTAERVSRRTATAATRNAGSVFAEAIPIAGIAVIVGVTAWDLKDACDTMYDLHQLELAFNPGAAADPEATEVCGLTVPTKDEVWGTVKSSPANAWSMAKDFVPDLPDLTMPDIDWTFWN